MVVDKTQQIAHPKYVTHRYANACPSTPLHDGHGLPPYPTTADSSQGILNDAVCSHELVREKIDQLLASIGRPIGGALDPVQLYLKMHKDMSVILEEVSLWGRERILFNRVSPVCRRTINFIQFLLGIGKAEGRNDFRRTNRTDREA